MAAANAAPALDLASSRRSLFRPCIDLHDGQVKQIVGGTLSDDKADAVKTNFVSAHPPRYFADLYAQHQLEGGHVIKLGPGNDDAARDALAAWPDHLQLGGGITAANAAEWIAAGASKVIVTSWLFKDGKFDEARAQQLVDTVGRERLVLDLSCRRKPGTQGWFVAIQRWQVVTDLEITQATLDRLSKYCCEFLVHAADVEGLCQGIDEDLVRCLADWSPLPVTYAGGARNLDDLQLVHTLSHGRVDLTIGSALDVFGGSGARFADCVAWNTTGLTPSVEK
ncbi:uncharacterized protein MONBRDRAFT_21369 [Monosiga brevicollis MX1]|uniref:1-(5-phosphoribosyl)-5-[(5-phosphoribosylamino)methylideneamino]imidazole-4-carboxamideisomerase n=1 Tax=Monosiga brevicollis TaxID=81824 RepID=A9UW68_MONBE|nr:uncharacterized protein MONBRDRAFT_21369 [Monosiga brevicollis MX1]EDQ90715.1 predicted protein [Monosiga brevicollis MX1]|eukprot:XP_001744766.1 hypothetical protein [Monosiga brevicollis MX1]